MKEMSRMNEWFVPKFGPLKFRAFIGMLFLPYTGMCVSFAIIGSLLSPTIIWDRVYAIIFIYFLSVGLSAHAADHIGSRKIKPWGSFFSNKELVAMTTLGISVAYATGIYYMVNFVPLLWPVSIAEGFFLFAYNLELFGGFFHNNVWFAISWGSLPVLAGYIIQTNSLSEITIMVSAMAGVVSYIEIITSRRYKGFMMQNAKPSSSRKLESQLKIISLGTILFTIALMCVRIGLDV